MARLMRDCNNRHLIEVMSARKYVHCVIKDGCLVRCKKLPLTKLIRNDQSEAGAEQYDRWWKPVPETEYPLAQAVQQFLTAGNSTGWSITAKAQAVLSALLESKSIEEDDMQEDEAVPPAASAEGEIKTGEADMSKKAKVEKSSKPKKEKLNGERTIKLIAEKKFHEGSVRGKCYAVIAKHKKLTVSEYLRHCSGREIKKAQAMSCLAKLCEPKQKVQTVELV